MNTETMARMPSLPGIDRTAPYEQRPPSPPYIHVPSVAQHGFSSVVLRPSFESADWVQLTEEDVKIITQGKTQTATDQSHFWRYESRRQAQPILDCLYLGPSSAARDTEFLQKEGMTMLLAARDSRLAQARLLSVEKTARELGLAADYVDISSRQELIRMLPFTVKKISNHLLSQHRSRAPQADKDASGGPGKVLVFCETGNDMSAAIVAAYIMALYDANLVTTIQFICLKRFCANFDDEMKNLLKSYEDILVARKMVNSTTNQPAPTGTAKCKRGIADTMDGGVDDMMKGLGEHDGDRYIGRDFAPFIDRDVSMNQHD